MAHPRELLRVVQLRPDLSLPSHRRSRRRTLDPRRLYRRSLVADRRGARHRNRPGGADRRARHPLRRRRARLAVVVDPLPRRRRERGAAHRARGDLHRASGRRRGDALPVGLEGERAAGGAPRRDRARPHATPPVAPHPRPRDRADPGPLRGPRDGDLHHPGSRPERGGARGGRAARERRAARVFLHRHLGYASDFDYSG
jgi:hypothetical protein